LAVLTELTELGMPNSRWSRYTSLITFCIREGNVGSLVGQGDFGLEAREAKRSQVRRQARAIVSAVQGVLPGGNPPRSVAAYQHVERHLRERSCGIRGWLERAAGGVEGDAPDLRDGDVRGGASTRTIS
jgi:hypothetical protein